MRPHRHHPADNRGCRERSKISTVKRVLGLPIHDKDIAFGNDAASLPGGKRTASSVAFPCIPDIDAIDSDRKTISADRLPWESQHALDHGDADRQIAIEIKESREKIRGLDSHELCDGQPCHRLNMIKTYWNAI